MLSIHLLIYTEVVMTDEVNSGRRRLLTTVTTGVGLAGAAALAVPLLQV